LKNIEILSILLSLPAVLLSLSVHEFFHAFAAYKLGDKSQKYMGRLTLNPLKHIDPIGFIALLVLRAGWAKPVQVDSRYFDNPKKAMAITSLAGPASNFLLAFICTFLFVLFERIGFLFSLFSISTPYYIFCLIVYFMIPINLGLGIFNLIPIPPLDGSKILYSFLPNRVIYKILPYEKYIQLALILLLMLGVLGTPIGIVSEFFEGIFTKIANGVFDLCLPIS